MENKGKHSTKENLEHMVNETLPATVEDFKIIGTQVDSMVSNVASVVSTVSTSIVKINEVSSQVKLECKRLEHALDMLMVKAQTDIQIYEKSLPILEQQFKKCQERMDKLMDKSMEFISEDVNQENLNRQEAMMKLIEIANESINTLVAKLIPQY